MILKFQVEAPSKTGQVVYLSGSIPELGRWNMEKALAMVYSDEGWAISIAPKNIPAKVEYYYFIKTENRHEKEFGQNRVISINSNSISIKDTWRSNHHDSNLLYSSPFRKAFFDRDPKKPQAKYTYGESIIFRLRAVRIDMRYTFCIVGSSQTLGNWNQNEAIVLDEVEYSHWEVRIPKHDASETFEYKYAIFDQSRQMIINWEVGSNRTFRPNTEFSSQIITDEYFEYHDNWKGTGVAIPVFSIRTNKGFGIGEFTDLKLMVEWASKIGLNLIQILPVNDTTATHTWTDSYPYSGISVFALHPIYANIDAIGKLDSTDEQKKLDSLKLELNNSESLDYEGVIKAKWHYFQLKYDEVKETFLQSDNFKKFFSRNKEWLMPYAVFCYLRDKNNTADFNKWGDFKSIDWNTLNQLNSIKNIEYDKIAIHYFIQYYLDQQLKEVTDFARLNRVVIKGDIPIGVCRDSVDVWLNPKLFNLNGQSGAPPDSFSDSGQNWGFPTYNWDEMAKDNYLWWRQRLQKMEDYFDVFRIDHILGFFRIWEIPYNQIEGTLGGFNPALPYSIDELESLGIEFNHERDCKPYITQANLDQVFGESVLNVTQSYFDKSANSNYHFKPEFDTQRKIKDHFDDRFKPSSDHDNLKVISKGLMKLHREVIFIETADGKMNPNIDLFNTHSFNDLKGSKKVLLMELHHQYFFNRHNEFWRKKAMEKLSVLKSATEMLVCGEDLGMAPGCVPGIMHDLQLLSLTIQRMPTSDMGEFWDLRESPYLSVCSPGTHDISTIRGWWEEDSERAQSFYNGVLGNEGEAPFYCEPWIVKQIIDQHLQSPSMWTIIPIQDFLALDENVRRLFPRDEQINKPEVSNYYWRYRLHILLEDLMMDENLNQQISDMINDSGRFTNIDHSRRLVRAN